MAIFVKIKNEMKEKKNILMICSWLDVEKNIGSFFWEQAEIMQPKYSIILCNFNKKTIKLKSIFSFFKRNKIAEIKAPNGIVTYQIKYNYFKFLPEKINTLILKNSIKKFNVFLKKTNFNIDLIHAQSIFNAGLIGLYYQKIEKIPFIFTEHNQFNLRNKARYEIKLVNQVLSKSSKNLVVSYDKIRQFAANEFYSNFEVVGNSINEEVFYLVDEKTNNELFTITTIGAFDPIKDQITILKSLKLIDKELKNKVFFNWIGFNGWGFNNTNQVTDLINSYKFENIKVNLFESLSRNEIASKLRETNLFLFSSISEGLPVSVIEALACGVPVCTTRCGGVDELIDDYNGKIIQIKDYKDMSNFILYFIQNEYKYDKKAISKETIVKNGKVAFFNKLDEIYSSIIYAK